VATADGATGCRDGDDAIDNRTKDNGIAIDDAIDSKQRRYNRQRQ
jgi:hypothetical protein